MKHKRLCALLLSAALLGSSLPAALAAEPVADTTTNQTDAQKAASRVLYYGKIQSLTYEGDALRQVKIDSPKDGEIVFWVDENTLYLNSGEAIPAAAGDLQEGMPVYIYGGSAMTMSLPPQTYAEAFVLNVPQDAACASLHTIEEVTKNADGDAVILTDDGSLYLTVDKDAALSDWQTKNRLSLDDLTVGTRIFAWYQGVQESYPAQAFTNRVVVAPALEDETEEPEEKPAEGSRLTIVLDGDMVLDGWEAKVENGVVMVPVRVTAETLNGTVSWDADTRTATIDDSERMMTITPGQTEYVSAASPETDLIGMTAPVELGAAYIDADGHLWAPAELFTVLQGYTVETSADTVYITRT